MSRRVQQLIPALKQFKRMNAKNRKAFLNGCSKEFIHGICECVKNLLKGHVPLKSSHLKCLARHKHLLRKLALKKTTLDSRKKILQKGGFLQLLLPTLISGLGSLVGSIVNNAARQTHGTSG
jgi:hypothetical protein